MPATLDAITTAATLDAPARAGILAPDDLAEVIQAYSAVADRLQASHEALAGEVDRLRRELASKNAQLERGKRLTALGEMAAGIAHEIRNPLAAIQLYVEMVAADLAAPAARGSAPDAAGGSAPHPPPADPAQTLDTTRKIADAVRGLSAIVNDVLSFARHIEPCARRLDARQVIHRVLDAHRPDLLAQRVEVLTDVGYPTVDADPELLHQALLNLVRNAVDAMAEQPDDRALLLEVGEETITVADTGPGLTDDAAERIFNPFFTTRSTGTGLGLAIVHRIVDAHGGSIAVHNDPEHGGAVFTLTLPSSEGRSRNAERPRQVTVPCTAFPVPRSPESP